MNAITGDNLPTTGRDCLCREKTALPAWEARWRNVSFNTDHCWLLLVNWYKSITIQIKHNCELSIPIKVCKGTRQGGLSSPFLFNLFYQEMVEALAECNVGIKINGTSYNLFVYADDILLTSLSATGLQTMINVADKYITDHGLRFNPSKTECTIFGKCHLDPPPE